MKSTLQAQRPAQSAHSGLLMFMQRCFIIPLLGILLLCCCANTRADDGWSKPVNNLRARLTLERDPNSSFLKLFVEFQNVADFMGNIRIRFKPEHLTLEVKDSKKHAIEKPGTVNYSAMKPRWDEPLLLPLDGNLRFRVSFPGFSTQPGNQRTIIDHGFDQIWVVPEEGDHFLSGQITIPSERGDHSFIDWSGTLELPPIKIPKASLESRSAK
ncbi:MAG: hypothetical protein ACYC67_05145 [Prosthecobacter sp.]